MLSEDGIWLLCGHIIRQAILDADDPKYHASESDLSPQVFLDAAGIPLEAIPALAARIREGEHHNLSRRTPVRRRSNRKAA